jgi:hypothetical protein
MIVPVCFVAMALVAFELLMRDVYKMTSANRDAPLSDDENTEA